jgi:hypothetical protein
VKKVKQEFALKDITSFNEDEIEICAKSMRNYIEKAAKGIVGKWERGDNRQVA